MALTPLQVKTLRYDLQELAHIEYGEVMTELLDHYAVLTEQQMATGIPFEEASKWAWAALGSGPGLQRIQSSFVKSIQQQVSHQHRAILKSYFRWPRLLTSLLVTILACVLVPTLPVKWVIVGVAITSLSPALLLLWFCRAGFDRKMNTKRIVWTYMKNKGAMVVNIFQGSLNIPAALFGNGNPITREWLQAYPVISVIACLLALLYRVSFVQLFYKKLHYQFA